MVRSPAAERSHVSDAARASGRLGHAQFELAGPEHETNCPSSTAVVDDVQVFVVLEAHAPTLLRLVVELHP